MDRPEYTRHWCDRCQESHSSADGHRLAPVALTVQAAIRIVARDLIDKVVVAARDTDNMWEWYPEIGEHDWERVTDHVEAYLSVNLRVPRETFDAAYTLLTERANQPA